MNKDVVYIEPEDDITDIISKIKSAKNKIVALVPPKKAGVLRSIVNFKLIAKTAAQHEKTIVLISTDEGLMKFAASVKMPVAKSLNSKPQLSVDDADEFGEDEDDDLIEDDTPKEEIKGSDKKDSKDSHKKESIPAKKVASKADMEISDEDELAEDESSDKKASKKKNNKNVPNFKKYQKQIIAGGLAAIILVVVLIWAFAIAPAAKVIVTVSTASKNFSENITFVTKEDKADVENGVFYAVEQTIEKTDSIDFEATGEVDKGAKASGSIVLKRTSPIAVESIDDNFEPVFKSITVPAGATFTYNGLKYVSTTAVTLKAPTSSQIGKPCKNKQCNLTQDITAEVNVVAAENGEKYNMSASNNGNGWSLSVSGVTVSNSKEMTGGSSKIVKVVSEDDIANAEENLDASGESDVKSELKEKFGSEYILIDSSFNANSGTPSASPALNEEVANDVKPKLVKKTKYTIYAINRSDVASFIEATVKGKLGDDTQKVYTTGADEDAEKTKAFFESYKNNDGKMTAKLKSTVQTGPNITEEMISEKALGKKKNELKSSLGSINGVKSVNVETSGFWVTTIPNDPNKVEIEIKVED